MADDVQAALGRLRRRAPTRAATAKPEIWKEQAKFKEHSDKLVAETGKLLAAAKTGNLDTLKAAFGSAAGTCKACHDAFRKRLSAAHSKATPAQRTGAAAPQSAPEPQASASSFSISRCSSAKSGSPT